MVRVPQAAARNSFQPPTLEQNLSSASARAPQVSIRRRRIDAAQSANRSVSSINVLSQIAGVRPEAPLVYAPFGAKREPPRRHFEIAPSAQRPLVLALWQRVAFSRATGHCSQFAHPDK
jgi:hypothetical protein